MVPYYVQQCSWTDLNSICGRADKSHCMLFADELFSLVTTGFTVLHVTFNCCPSSSLDCRNGCDLRPFPRSLLRAQLALLYRIDFSVLYCMYFSRWVPTAGASVWKTTIIPSSRISEATQKRAELRKLISSGLPESLWMSRQKLQQVCDSSELQI